MNAGSLVRKLKARYNDSILLKRLLAVLSIDILVKLSGVLLLPVYLRLMTQEEYGLYSYLLSIILTFSVVLNFGLYVPLSKFYHDDIDPVKRGELLFTVFSLLTLILSGILLPIYLFHWDYTIVHILFKNPINYDSYRGTILLAVIVSVLNFMLTNFFYTSEKIRHLQKYNISRILLINFLTVFLLYILRGKDTIRVRLETTYLIELVLFLIFSYFYIKETVPRLSKLLVRPSLKMALPVTSSAVFGIVINFSDKFFLEKYGSFKNLSYYYLAVSCAGIIPLIYTSFQNAWLPLFLKEKDLQKNIARTNKLLIRLFVGFLGLGALIILFLKVILVFGIIQAKYEKTIYILPFILLAQIFGALVPVYTNYLIYFQKMQITFVTGFIVCCISLSLSLLLIPRYGVYGAATVSLLCNLSYFVIYYFIIKSYTKKHLALNHPDIGQSI